MFDDLRGRRPQSIDEESYRQFAVMVPLIRQGDDIFVLFEKRSGSLKRQPGEICFPGGAREGDETPLQNAVRETAEELRITVRQIDVIAQMNTLLTVYDNKVSVFLCELKDYAMTYAPAEVGEVFLVPLNFFMEQKPDVYVNRVELHTPDDFPYEKVPGGRNYHWHAGRKNVYFYYYEDKVIWGMTAYIMQDVVRTISRESKGKEVQG